MPKRREYQPPPGYLASEKAAAKVGVHPRTWWRWRYEKIAPPGTWIGGRLLWRETAIDEWLVRREEPASP